MDAEIKEKWVKALRSGDYRQSRRSIRVKEPDGGYSYCCLGVLDAACEFNALSTQFPYEVIERRADWMGQHMSQLIQMNDTEKKSFAQIADWIEANL